MPSPDFKGMCYKIFQTFENPHHALCAYNSSICSYCTWLMSVHVLFRILDMKLSNDATIEVARSSATIFILLR